MRSPPVRHASLHSESDAGAPEPVERRRSSLTLPHTVPQHVLDDATRIHLGHCRVRNDRDRRLRLLIRRYVNQIQHGCQNRSCSISTCLSYRKRNSKGPLRQYSDLSARTLACHLVEEYSQAGKDPSAGLCHSQPNIPWYEDPTVNQVRRHPSRSYKQGKDERCNGRTPEDARTSGKGRTGHKGRIEQRVDSEEQHRVQLKSSHTKAAPEIEDEEPNERLQTVRFDEEDAGDDAQEKPQAQLDSNTPPPADKKDLASFVQSVWDTLALRKLSTRPGRSKSDRHQGSVVTFNDADADPSNCSKVEQPHEALPRPAGVEAEDRDAETSTSNMLESSVSTMSWQSLYRRSSLDITFNDAQHLQDTDAASTAFCGFTLRRLSWKTLTWLVDVHNAAEDYRGTPFENFLRHSIFTNLSNPSNLYESSQSWSSDREDADADAETDGNQSQEAQSDKEADKKPRREHASRPEKKNQPRVFNVSRSLEAFDILATLSNGTDDVYDALHTALQQCYTLGIPTPSSRRSSLALKSFKRAGGGMMRVSDAPEPSKQPLGKMQVAEVFLSALMACLMPLFSEELADAGFSPVLLTSIADIRNDNRAYPVMAYKPPGHEAEDVHLRQLFIEVMDHFDDWHLLRLTTSLMDCLSHHLAASALRNAQRPLLTKPSISRNVLEIMLDRLCDGLPEVESGAEFGFRAIIWLSLIEMTRSVLLKEWDREPVVRRTGPVGGAFELLAALFRQRYVWHSHFYMPFIARAFDELDMPLQWERFQSNGRETHVLAYSFLFEPATLVKYFRSINVHAMRRSHEAAAAYCSDARQFLGSTIIPVYGGKEVLAALRPHMAKYLVLTIRRSNVLEDALNQIWRRQRREILRPLRVRLGKDEGEDGLDHGGVQQEFFRLVFAEAFRPEYGMFTVDYSTRMTWFQPGSLEPLHKFEVLGILMSLAVYNAVTLPITFPIAFYRKLLGLKVKKLWQIKDGWPDLTKGLQMLLDFDGEVAEVISRTYEFSYDFSGSVVTVDMQKHGREDPWPASERPSRKGKEKAKSASFELPLQLDITPPSQSPPMRTTSRTSSLKGISTPLSLESETLEEAALVTNENREQYVKDYVFWLTDKSIRPQFEAFHRGFFTCIDHTALSMFNPEALRDVMEGSRDIDIDELERTATYEEYEKSSEYMRLFWQVVRSFSTEQHKQLLEFVTASNRVPVNGLESIQFIVQKNGDEDGRLPSSSTCYGRLLLPQYSTRQILEEKLGKALENSLGFGAL